MFSTVLVLFFAASLVPQVEGNVCATEVGAHRCEHIVTCSVYSGSASVPSCEDYSPIVFVIKDSPAETLVPQFFAATNFDTRVYSIKAFNNNWKIIENGALKYYTNSRSIEFTNNKITTIRDLVFRNYLVLETLNLSRNAIESIGQKTFVITLESREPSLREIDLSHNKIKVLKEEIFKTLTKLRTLKLNNNEIVTITDAAFRGCSSLENLNLGHNFMAAINLSLHELTGLKRLDLSFNLLEKIYGYEFNRLESIVSLNMSNNMIKAVEGNSFILVNLLEELDLSYNKLSPTMDTLTFAGQHYLKYLNFFNNSLSKLQENTFKFNQLTFLNLGENILTGAIEENTFVGLSNVTNMNLSEQNITSLEKCAFSHMSNLTSLNLNSNNISNIHNSSFFNVTLLKILDLSQNNISSLGFLQNCLFNLTHINLSSNILKTIMTNAFINQTSLIKLDLTKNNIIYIQKNSLPLIKLQYLELQGNNLTGYITKDTFSPAEFLRNLDLSNFHIKGIEDNAFVGLKTLGRFNLSRNEIDFIGLNNFMGMPNVYSIDLSHNRLTNFKTNNTSLNNLQALYLNNNKLDEFDEPFLNLSKLMYLDLSFNIMSDLKLLKFRNHPELKVLLLTNNALNEFNSPETDSLPLVRLELAYNKISRINISCFKQIFTLNISHNNLEFINASSLMNYNLQVLDLSGNAITALGPGTFQFTTMLKLLNVSHNRISELRYGSLRGLQHTDVVDLSHNKLNKLDVDIFHECLEIRKLFIDNNSLENFEVERLIMLAPNLEAVSLGHNPMPCREIVRNLKVMKNYTISGRQIEVTSADKVYHEDNVNGIKCGNSKVIDSSSDQGSGSNALTIWCSVLTVVLVIALGVVYVYFRRIQSYAPASSRIHLRDTLSFGGSEFGN